MAKSRRHRFSGSVTTMNEAVGAPVSRTGLRRPSPAARARVIAAGVAATAAFTMVAGMALPGGGSAAATPPAQADVTGSNTPAEGDIRMPGLGAVPATPAPAPATSSSGS